MLGNWVRQTTTTTGTGNLTLSSVSGYPTFADNFGSTGQRFRYVILDDSTGAPIEAGIGHLSSSTVLVRDIVTATYVSGVYAEPNSTTGQVTLAAGTWRVICAADQTTLAQNPVVSPALANATANNKSVCPSNYQSIATTALAITSGRLYAWPVYIGSRGPFNGFICRTSANGANVDMALYRLLDSGLPGAKVAGATAVASGNAAPTIGSVTSFSIEPGWYVMAINTSSGTPQYYSCMLNDCYGWTDTAVPNPCVYLTQAAGTLPDPFGTPTVIGHSITSTNRVPTVILRLA